MDHCRNYLDWRARIVPWARRRGRVSLSQIMDHFGLVPTNHVADVLRSMLIEAGFNAVD